MGFSERLQNIKAKRLASEKIANQQIFEELSNFNSEKYLEENCHSFSKEFTFQKIGQIVSAGLFLIISSSVVAGIVLVAAGGASSIVTGAVLLGGGFLAATLAAPALMEASFGLTQTKEEFMFEKAEDKKELLQYQLKNSINEKTKISDFISACKESFSNSFNLSKITEKFSPLSDEDLNQKLKNLGNSNFTLNTNTVLNNIKKHLDTDKPQSPAQPLKPNA